jgi:hypothetical protein
MKARSVDKQKALGKAVGAWNSLVIGQRRRLGKKPLLSPFLYFITLPAFLIQVFSALHIGGAYSRSSRLQKTTGRLGFSDMHFGLATLV